MICDMELIFVGFEFAQACSSACSGDLHQEADTDNRPEDLDLVLRVKSNVVSGVVPHQVVQRVVSGFVGYEVPDNRYAGTGTAGDVTFFLTDEPGEVDTEYFDGFGAGRNLRRKNEVLTLEFNTGIRFPHSLFDVGAAGKCRAECDGCDREGVIFEHMANWIN